MDTHILFKFNYHPWAKPGPQSTIDLHKAIIKERGNVWWGRTSGISQDKAEALKHQIQDGIPTYAFLYGFAVPKKISPSGILWYRAKLIDVVLCRPKSIEMIPEYYRNHELEFYALLGDIEEIKFEADNCPKVPGQTPLRHVSFQGKAIPENLTFSNDKDRKLCVFGKDKKKSEIPFKKTQYETPTLQDDTAPVDSLALKVIDLLDEVIILKDEISRLKTYQDFYSKILNTDYLFSSEKFFENWIQENMHKIFPELIIIERQPSIAWPDGKFGRLDLLAFNQESKELVIVEVKTRKRSKNSGYDQYLRYTSWAKRNLEQLKNKYSHLDIQTMNTPNFILISDFVDDEMKAICKDHGIILMHIFGGLGFEKFV